MSRVIICDKIFLHFDLSLDGVTTHDEQYHHYWDSRDSEAKLRSIIFEYDNEKLTRTTSDFLILPHSKARTNLHRHAHENKEVELEQADHNLVVLIHLCGHHSGSANLYLSQSEYTDASLLGWHRRHGKWPSCGRSICAT